MVNCLIALDKCSGVRSIRIGRIWHWLLAKCILKVTSTKAKDACGSVQLYAGLKVGIEGAVHAACTLFAKRDNEEGWGFLLVDVANACNAANRIACLWTVRHRRAVQHELLPPSINVDGAP